MSTRRRKWSIALFGLLVGGGAFYLLADGPLPGRSAEPAPRKADRVRVNPRAPKVRSPMALPPSTPDEAMEEMYIAIQPEAQVVRCDVGGVLEDGVYELRPDKADHPMVRGGVLTALVQEPQGKVQIERHLAVRGTLSWADGTCEVQAPQMVNVRGTLSYADGTPAVDHDVRGCLHGSFGVTDQDGAWQVQAMSGAMCHPMAFTETEDGDFGKSNVVNVQVGTEDVDGVVLVLPADEDLWDEQTLSKLSGSLVPMISERLESHKQRSRTLKAALERTRDPQSRQALSALIANEEVWLEWIDTELRRFEDPDERSDALRDMWMNLY